MSKHTAAQWMLIFFLPAVFLSMYLTWLFDPDWIPFAPTVFALGYSRVMTLVARKRSRAGKSRLAAPR